MPMGVLLHWFYVCHDILMGIKSAFCRLELTGSCSSWKKVEDLYCYVYVNLNSVHFQFEECNCPAPSNTSQGSPATPLQMHLSHKVSSWALLSVLISPRNAITWKAVGTAENPTRLQIFLCVILINFVLTNTVKPILRDHWQERPPILKGQIFLTEGSSFQRNCTEHHLAWESTGLPRQVLLYIYNTQTLYHAISVIIRDGH